MSEHTTPATANTLGIICAALICTLTVSVMIQPEPVKQVKLADIIEQANREADAFHEKQKQKKRNKAWTKAEKDAAYAALFTGYGYDR